MTLNIGDIKIDSPFILAPMAGVNSTSFRILCKENNCALIYTQMYDAEFLINKTKKEVEDFINIKDLERPVTIQLIGNSKEYLIKAVKLIEDIADIIDLNLGCIEERYLKKGMGGALLKDEEKIPHLIKAMKDATTKPITAKIRIGWDSQSINAVKISKSIESKGADAIAIHGRTVNQKYGGKINWTAIKQIKNNLSIPIIANGDVKNYKEGLALLEKTTADFVMIGRRAKNKPWIFNKDFKKTSKNVKEQMLHFIELYKKYENRYSLNEIREHIYWMSKNIKTNRSIKKVHDIQTETELIEYIKRLK